MSTQEPGRAQPGLTPLPKLEDLPSAADGYERAKVQQAFDSFRRHVTSLHDDPAPPLEAEEPEESGEDGEPKRGRAPGSVVDGAPAPERA